MPSDDVSMLDVIQNVRRECQTQINLNFVEKGVSPGSGLPNLGHLHDNHGQLLNPLTSPMGPRSPLNSLNCPRSPTSTLVNGRPKTLLDSPDHGSNGKSSLLLAKLSGAVSTGHNMNNHNHNNNLNSTTNLNQLSLHDSQLRAENQRLTRIVQYNHQVLCKNRHDYLKEVVALRDKAREEQCPERLSKLRAKGLWPITRFLQEEEPIMFYEPLDGLQNADVTKGDHKSDHKSDHKTNPTNPLSTEALIADFIKTTVEEKMKLLLLKRAAEDDLDSSESKKKEDEEEDEKVDPRSAEIIQNLKDSVRSLKTKLANTEIRLESLIEDKQNLKEGLERFLNLSEKAILNLGEDGDLTVQNSVKGVLNGDSGLGDNDKSIQDLLKQGEAMPDYETLFLEAGALREKNKEFESENERLSGEVLELNSCLNSGGGNGSASDELANEIASLKEKISELESGREKSREEWVIDYEKNTLPGKIWEACQVLRDEVERLKKELRNGGGGSGSKKDCGTDPVEQIPVFENSSNLVNAGATTVNGTNPNVNSSPEKGVQLPRTQFPFSYDLFQDQKNKLAELEHCYTLLTNRYQKLEELIRIKIGDEEFRKMRAEVEAAFPGELTSPEAIGLAAVTKNLNNNGKKRGSVTGSGNMSKEKAQETAFERLYADALRRQCKAVGSSSDGLGNLMNSSDPFRVERMIKHVGLVAKAMGITWIGGLAAGGLSQSQGGSGAGGENLGNSPSSSVAATTSPRRGSCSLGTQQGPGPGTVKDVQALMEMLAKIQAHQLVPQSQSHTGGRQSISICNAGPSSPTISLIGASSPSIGTNNTNGGNSQFLSSRNSIIPSRRGSCTSPGFPGMGGSGSVMSLSPGTNNLSGAPTVAKLSVPGGASSPNLNGGSGGFMSAHARRHSTVCMLTPRGGGIGTTTGNANAPVNAGVSVTNQEGAGGPGSNNNTSQNFHSRRKTVALSGNGNFGNLAGNGGRTSISDAQGPGPNMPGAGGNSRRKTWYTVPGGTDNTNQGVGPTTVTNVIVTNTNGNANANVNEISGPGPGELLNNSLNDTSDRVKETLVTHGESCLPSTTNNVVSVSKDKETDRNGRNARRKTVMVSKERREQLNKEMEELDSSEDEESPRENVTNTNIIPSSNTNKSSTKAPLSLPPLQLSNGGPNSGNSTLNAQNTINSNSNTNANTVPIATTISGKKRVSNPNLTLADPWYSPPTATSPRRNSGTSSTLTLPQLVGTSMKSSDSKENLPVEIVPLTKEHLLELPTASRNVRVLEIGDANIDEEKSGRDSDEEEEDEHIVEEALLEGPAVTEGDANVDFTTNSRPQTSDSIYNTKSKNLNFAGAGAVQQLRLGSPPGVKEVIVKLPGEIDNSKGNSKDNNPNAKNSLTGRKLVSKPRINGRGPTTTTRQPADVDSKLNTSNNMMNTSLNSSLNTSNLMNQSYQSNICHISSSRPQKEDVETELKIPSTVDFPNATTVLPNLANSNLNQIKGSLPGIHTTAYVTTSNASNSRPGTSLTSISNKSITNKSGSTSTILNVNNLSFQGSGLSSLGGAMRGVITTSPPGTRGSNGVGVNIALGDQSSINIQHLDSDYMVVGRAVCLTDRSHHRSQSPPGKGYEKANLGGSGGSSSESNINLNGDSRGTNS